MTASARRTFHYDPVLGEMQVFGRTIPLPKSRLLRIVIGFLLIIGGLLSFLPVLGIWMIPLGFLVLSQDFARVRRWRRSASLWLGRNRRERGRRRG